MMLTAAVMMPMLGIVGAAVDMSRGYMAKTRLQQACDAGVLAGRRAMTNSEFTAEAKTQAMDMFKFNFPLGQYSSTKVDFVPAKASSSDVQAVATATIPQSIMYIMGMKPFQLTVECVARQEIANTDIMLVLDTTTSMLTVNAGDSTDRITALRAAVMSFFDTITQAATDDGIIRFGLVPYADNVNTRELMFAHNPNYIADSVIYPSRRYYGSSNYTAYYTYRGYTLLSSALKNGGSTSARVGDGGANVTIRSSNCMMEPDTVAFAPGSPTPANAYDMDIDHVPGTADATKFKVLAPDYVFPQPFGGDTATDRSSFTQYGAPRFECPNSPARKLVRMRASDRATFKGWIDGLDLKGGTIHTAGMAWGARLLSPDGMFAAENRQSANGRPVSRHIIFMTDGEMDAWPTRLTYQGYEFAMQRLGAADEDELEDRNRDRFQRLCAQVRAKDITIWVVNFGTSAGPETANCASPGKFMPATNNAQLNQQFQSIARQISRLRLTK